MSISGTWLLTGLRGNGKTLRAVELMAKEVETGRPVFASNFEGLNLPGVEIWDDPRQWRELPPGSVLFVDEAQRFWRSRRSGEVPPEVQAMETQRHDGISMVLLTQQPTYLDKHVRGLVDRHFHLVRRAGLQASQVYEWERCKDEPESPANLELADASVWPFPTKFYGAYKSAEVHTVKRRLPARLKLIVAGVAVVGCLFWWSVTSLRAGTSASEPDAAVVSAAGDTPADRVAPTVERTAETIAASMKPRIPGAMWSAPIFDGVVKVQQPPKLVCMIGSTCRCMTDQGTSFAIDQAECRLIVKNGGIWNPYLQQDRGRSRLDDSRRDAGAGQRPAAMASLDAASSSGAVMTSPQVTGYGDIGARMIEPATDTGF